MKQQPKILKEGLRPNDLKGLVSDVFTVDRFKSKMGEDADIVVLGFRVKEKYPAIDLMEFIEKGYKFILDADISTGEEQDGQYQVFVEMERTPELPVHLKELFNGIANLTDCSTWRFRYQKDSSSVEFNESTVVEHIPMTPEEYHNKIFEYKATDVKEFFNQGSSDTTLESDNTITFTRPFAGDLKAKFISIGDYRDVKQTLEGPLDLSESGQSEVIFLSKFLGNYDIDKIGNRFLIRNGDRAVVIERGAW